MIKTAWLAAIARGDAMFDAGIPCAQGHTALRWTNSRICVDCKRQRDREYNARNVEAHRERALKSARSRPEAVKEYQRKYYEANREVALRRTREWALANPARMRAHRAASTKVRKAAPRGDRRAVVAMREHWLSERRIPCYWCGKRTSKDDRHLDHIIPLSRGGADSGGNLCVSCVDCNLRKNRKMPEEWAGQHEMSLF